MEENSPNQQHEEEDLNKSLEEWHKENKHFKWPLIIFFLLILILIILIDLKII